MIGDCLLSGGAIAFSTLGTISQFISVTTFNSLSLQPLASLESSKTPISPWAIPKDREDCYDLLDRTSTLKIAVITPLSYRSTGQLRGPKTLDKVEWLARCVGDITLNVRTVCDNTSSSTLTTFANGLRVLKADLSFRRVAAAIKSALTYGDVQNRIAECSSKLNWAMSVFQASKSHHSDNVRL
ncbi:hypothetical protein FRB96_001988 [Tulasnella sp. 330]|nr:hypothetical protein FRB96_001988 [Tulasnella sp. 330]